MALKINGVAWLSGATCDIPLLWLHAAQTPIEEFTPTPAFPALQYLESVDEGGVAWRAGLRMGDFLIEVKSIPDLEQLMFSSFYILLVFHHLVCIIIPALHFWTYFSFLIN